MYKRQIVGFIGFRLVLRRDAPIMGGTFHLPAKNDIDSRIIVGPAVFGVGWGLGGFCPGPALTALGLGEPGTLAFLPAMFLGMWAARAASERPILLRPA